VAIVLCDTGDVAALWTVGELQGRGVPIVLATAPAIGNAKRWTHRVGTMTLSELVLPDGTLISSADAEPVLNRLGYAPVTRISAGDYDYAAQEMHALMLSFLHAWPGIVVNRPTPQGLAGCVRHPSVWRVHARAAGLRILPWHQTDDSDPDLAWQPQTFTLTAFVVGTRVIAPGLPEELAEPCRRLAQSAGALLLGVDFAHGGNGWAVASANPQPYLPHGGAALADALADLLRGKT
jgi:hypothetical protein